MGVVVPFPKKYDPSRGGHAPEHLRVAFLRAVTPAGFPERFPETVIVPGVGEKPFRWLLGQMWNCSDHPAADMPAVSGRFGRTYASTARRIARALAAERGSRVGPGRA